MQGRPTHLRSKGEVASHYLAANPETTYEPVYEHDRSLRRSVFSRVPHDCRLNACSKIP